MSQRTPVFPGPVETAVAFWRWLRRMRTALYLLGALAAAVFLATLVPQEPNVPATVTAWRAGTEGPGAAVASAMDALGLFDVFGAAWFLVLLFLLFTSLTACLVPRVRAFYRVATRGLPPRSRDLDGKDHVARADTSASPAEALARARDVLQARHYRIRGDADASGPPPVRSDPRGVVVAAPADDAAGDGTPDAGQVASERGHLLREGGSLVFHIAFFVLLLGVVAGELFGFRGQVGIVEGEPGFADTPVAYWATDTGRFWQDSWHRGWRLQLDRFDVDWDEAGNPTTFVSHVVVDPPDGGEPIVDHLRVNDPLVVDGMKIHQLDWGYALRMVVRDGGDVVHDAPVLLRQAPGGFWVGALKAPAASPQLGLQLGFFPDAPDEDGRPAPTGRPEPEAPLVVFTVWEGDLQLDRAQSVDVLDTRLMEEAGRAALRPGTAVEVRPGTEVEFQELRRWSGLQVSRRPTDPLLLVAASLVLIGLLPALYAYRRRVWVEAVAVRTGETSVVVAGQAFQRPQAFVREHAAIAADIQRRLPPVGPDRGGRVAPPRIAGGTDVEVVSK
ncbi:MAG: cytochrome c biogenesis protein ResB [Nitriliruptorales bacterium]